MIEYKNEVPDAQSFFDLYQTTGWDKNGTKKIKLLYEAIENSWFMVAAYSDGKLVGYGRIISDGYLHAFITEMIIDPHFQGQGIGKEILSRLVEKATQAGISDIQLFCAQGKKDFYLKNGFDERLSDAPGMQWRRED